MSEGKEAPEKKGKTVIEEFFDTLKPTRKAVALVAVLLIMLSASAVLAYLLWIIILPKLWNWGFEDHPWKMLRAPGAVLGAFYVIVIPLLPLFYGTTQVLAPLFASWVRDPLRQKAEEASEAQEELEKELIPKDGTGLIEIVRNSRLQLKEYYYTGHSQAEKSFRYSILSMWIGFSLIILGAAAYLFPDLPIFPDQSILKNASNDSADGAKILPVASGVVIEFVSGVFLLVYIRSIRQLRYFFDAQNYNHLIIMCATIAEKANKSDEIRKLIVDRVLGQPRISAEEEPLSLGRITGKGLADDKTDAAAAT